MSKIHCFSNNFSKIASAEGLRPQRPLTFNIGELKLCNLAKLWIYKLIMKKSNFKNSVKNVTKIMSQNFSILDSPNQNFWLRQWLYQTL